MNSNVRFLRKTGTTAESYSYLDTAYQVFFQENAAAMYVAAIPEGTIEICNEAFVHLLGYDDADQIIGRSLAEFFQTSADYEKLALRFRNEQMIRGDLECLQKQDGSVIWILQDIGRFNEIGFDQPMILGTVFDVTKQKEREDKFHYHAMYDSLTGLANRPLFLDRLRVCFDRAQRKSDYRFAVLFLDLDYFKRVNDTFGHRVGDELLIACAKRLHSKIRGADTVARLCGDEFAVLLTEVRDRAEAVRVAARIQAAFNHPFRLDDTEILITVSAGIALSSGHWISSEENSSSVALSSLKKPEDLLWEADEVLYRAKSKGRARFEIADPAQEDTSELTPFAKELRFSGL